MLSRHTFTKFKILHWVVVRINGLSYPANITLGVKLVVVRVIGLSYPAGQKKRTLSYSTGSTAEKLKRFQWCRNCTMVYTRYTALINQLELF